MTTHRQGLSVCSAGFLRKGLHWQEEQQRSQWQACTGIFHGRILKTPALAQLTSWFVMIRTDPNSIWDHFGLQCNAPPIPGGVLYMQNRTCPNSDDKGALNQLYTECLYSDTNWFMSRLQWNLALALFKVRPHSSLVGCIASPLLKRLPYTLRKELYSDKHL